MKLRTIAIVVAILGVAAFLLSGASDEFSAVPSTLSDAAWPVFLFAVLCELGVGVTALIRRGRNSRVPSRS